MRLLDRYLLRELLLPLTYCVGGFLVCFLIFDLFDMIGELQRNKLSAGEIVEYYSQRIPQLMVTSYVLPMSLLLALLYALTNHARHHELTAMRAAGRSLLRISAPYFLVGLLFTGAVFALNEAVVPDSADNADEILTRHVGNQGRSLDRIWKKTVLFINPREGRAWQIGAYNLRTRTMINPQIDWRFADGSRLHMVAERAHWINRHWVLTNVQEFHYPPGVDYPTKTVVTETNLPRMMETPRLIASEIKISGLETLKSLRKTQISSAAILDYLQLHPQLDEKKRDSLLTLLHSRLAAPWTCFVVVLIAIPFGALPGRRNVFVGVASSITICFIFFVVKDLTLALGSGGHVPAWIAAWVPNAAFALAGMALLWRVR